jgi:hypothetical protein
VPAVLRPFLLPRDIVPLHRDLRVGGAPPSTPPEILGGDGIAAEVIDLRTVVPLDFRDPQAARLANPDGCESHLLEDSNNSACQVSNRSRPSPGRYPAVETACDFLEMT